MSQQKTKTVDEELQQKLNAALDLIEKLKKSRKQTKEFSDYFCNSKREALKYKNLSETKKYFEDKHFEILDEMRKIANVERFTSEEFHDALFARIAR